MTAMMRVRRMEGGDNDATVMGDGSSNIYERHKRSGSSKMKDPGWHTFTPSFWWPISHVATTTKRKNNSDDWNNWQSFSIWFFGTSIFRPYVDERLIQRGLRSCWPVRWLSSSDNGQLGSLPVLYEIWHSFGGLDWNLFSPALVVALDVALGDGISLRLSDTKLSSR